MDFVLFDISKKLNYSLSLSLSIHVHVVVRSGYNNVLLYLLNKLLLCLYTLSCFFSKIKQIVNVKPKHLKFIQLHL